MRLLTHPCSLILDPCYAVLAWFVGLCCKRCARVAPLHLHTAYCLLLNCLHPTAKYVRKISARCVLMCALLVCRQDVCEVSAVALPSAHVFAIIRQLLWPVRCKRLCPTLPCSVQPQCVVLCGLHTPATVVLLVCSNGSSSSHTHCVVLCSSDNCVVRPLWCGRAVVVSPSRCVVLLLTCALCRAARCCAGPRNRQLLALIP